MLRIAFYLSHYNTLGHAMRLFSLVKGIKEYFRKGSEIVILESGKRQYSLPFVKYAHLYPVPYSLSINRFFVENRIKDYKKSISHARLKLMLRERFLFISRVLDKFSPNIFVTEFFPFGREFWSFEIPHLLTYLKNNFVCKIIGSCGYLNWTEHTYEYIKEFYDFIFIHCPREFIQGYRAYFHKEAAEELNRVLTDFQEKIFFTGFVLGKSKNDNYMDIRKRYLKSQHKGLIFVTRGGGMVGKRMILASLLAAKRNKDLFFIVCCGPYTTPKEFNEYKKLSRLIDNLQIFRVIHHSDFVSYIKAADLCINMAGYNTTTRIFYYGKKAILIPSHSEQMWKADLVSKLLPARVISEKDLNVPRLEKNIYELLEEDKKPVKINRDWFSGISNTIKILKSLN